MTGIGKKQPAKSLRMKGVVPFAIVKIQTTGKACFPLSRVVKNYTIKLSYCSGVMGDYLHCAGFMRGLRWKPPAIPRCKTRWLFLAADLFASGIRRPRCLWPGPVFSAPRRSNSQKTVCGKDTLNVVSIACRRSSTSSSAASFLKVGNRPVGLTRGRILK
jgi:hypothetical protein